MRWPWQRRRPKCVGLALSGGAVRGAAHVGVLEVLEEAGIRPDVVAGTSAGSLVGALYCAGVPLGDIKAEALELKWSKIGKVTRPRLGWFDISRLEERLNEQIGRRTFAELATPFAAVTADILAGEVVVLREGSVAAAVRASCSLPGIFTPTVQGERLLVDGGGAEQPARVRGPRDGSRLRDRGGSLSIRAALSAATSLGGSGDAGLLQFRTPGSPRAR